MTQAGRVYVRGGNFRRTATTIIYARRTSTRKQNGRRRYTGIGTVRRVGRSGPRGSDVSENFRVCFSLSPSINAHNNVITSYDGRRDETNVPTTGITKPEENSGVVLVRCTVGRRITSTGAATYWLPERTTYGRPSRIGRLHTRRAIQP